MSDQDRIVTPGAVTVSTMPPRPWWKAFLGSALFRSIAVPILGLSLGLVCTRLPAGLNAVCASVSEIVVTGLKKTSGDIAAQPTVAPMPSVEQLDCPPGVEQVCDDTVKPDGARMLVCRCVHSDGGR